MLSTVALVIAINGLALPKHSADLESNFLPSSAGLDS